MAYAHLSDGSRKIRLRDIDPEETGDLTKAEGIALTDRLGEEMAALQDLLFYAGRHSLLIVLQGRDTSGKDGSIRELLRHSNSQSCHVHPFKQPTAEELGHDFLWRLHARAPRRGETAIFNRSHYEDVIVVRVHGLVPEKVWRRRYDQINAFEATLRDGGTILLKACLHISKKEQEERLLAREAEREKAWKLNVGDWKEREHWNDTTRAYEDAINRCSTPEAPWLIVPADKKWYRNLAVVEAVVRALRPYRAEWLDALDQIGKKALAEIRAYRKSSGGTISGS